MRPAALVLAALLALTGPADSKKSDKNQFLNSAYVPEYRYEGVNLGEAGLYLSDVIIFSLEPADDGNLAGLDRIDKKKLVKIRNAKANMGFKMLIAIGGGGRSAGFVNVVKSGTRREKLVSEVVALCEKEGFDGVVIDMEVNFAADMGFLPGLRMIAKLIKEKNKKLVVAMAVHPGQERMFPQNLIKAFDRFHLMAYDYCPEKPCKHSTLEHAEQVVTEAIKVIPPHKLQLGIPAYGREMDNPPEAKTYAEIYDKWGEFPLDVDESNGFYFNGRFTVEKKVKFAEQQGLLGVFFWEAGQDLAATHRSSLIRVAGIEADRINAERRRNMKGREL